MLEIHPRTATWCYKTDLYIGIIESHGWLVGCHQPEIKIWTLYANFYLVCPLECDTKLPYIGMWESLVRYKMMLLSQSYLFVCLLKHPTCFIYLFCAIASHCNPASNLRPPYGADIALLSYLYTVILLLYMAGGEGRGGLPDLKHENICHVCNFISATPLQGKDVM